MNKTQSDVPENKELQISNSDLLSAQQRLETANEYWRDGELEQAVMCFQQVLMLDTLLERPYLGLAQIFSSQQRWQDVLSICQKGLRFFPNQIKLHKLQIKALTYIGGWETACDHYGLKSVGAKRLDLDRHDIICCCVVRDEFRRLPWFLRYYRDLGFKHFLFVDNGSTDGSMEFLKAQDDVYLWRSDMSFNQANFGSAWFEILLSRFGIERWCLLVDADELLCFDGVENYPITSLCAALDRQGKLAASGIMLDMYSAGPLSQADLQPGQNFFDVCSYFDRTCFHDEYPIPPPYRNQDLQFGGMRKRVFGEAVEYIVTKTPLVKYRPDTVLTSGQHFTSYPADAIAHLQVCVLHFKYFSCFVERSQLEAMRGEHSRGAEQCRAYVERLLSEDDLVLYDANESVKYSHSRQLLDLGIMRSGLAPLEPVFPTVLPVNAELTQQRPFWSVVITVYDRIEYVERVINSVLANAIPRDEMEIVLLNDGGAGVVFQQQLRALASATAGELIRVVCLDKNVGHPGIFNLAIELARGQWVHILHDDDFVKPGFYSALGRGIAGRPQLGAAFTRHELLDSAGRITWTSWLELENPGVIQDWLARIAVSCRLQFSAIVVRRSVYEELGAFYNQVGSAFDWEMWKRIAVNSEVWFEPDVLVSVTRDGTARTDELMFNGKQIEDAALTIPVTRTYLPASQAEFLSRQAYLQLSLYGLMVARTQIAEGDMRGALLNIRESLIANKSDEVVQALIESLK